MSLCIWDISLPNFGLIVIFMGIRTSIANKPFIFCDFSGGGGGVRTPCPPSGSAHDLWHKFAQGWVDSMPKTHGLVDKLEEQFWNTPSDIWSQAHE